MRMLILNVVQLNRQIVVFKKIKEIPEQKYTP